MEIGKTFRVTQKNTDREIDAIHVDMGPEAKDSGQ